MSGTLQQTTRIATFDEVLEAADALSPDDQEALIDILRRRLALAGRAQIVAEVQQALEEFAEGKCTPATPEEIVREIFERSES